MKIRSMMRRAGGAVTAAGLLLASLTAMPDVGAAEISGNDYSTCTYSEALTDATVTTSKPYEISLESLGVPATEKPTEIIVTLSISEGIGLPIMPAFGYEAAVSEESNWYGDGVWISSATSELSASFPVPEEYMIPNLFQIQIWNSEETAVVQTATIKGIGVNTGDSTGIGVMTRKGDVNDDKTVDVKDAVALAKYLIGTGELAAAENGDLDRNNRLNAIDLTLLKRGLINGTLGGSSDTGETAMEFVKHLKLGWNLGNTLDSTVNEYSTPNNAEQNWGCPITTKAMIDLVKSSGFNTIRIPVTWGEKCSGSDFTIDSAWMNRVQQVVDYAIDDGMYVILNIHHDNSPRGNNASFYPDQSHYDNSIKFITSVWKQVATRFEGYDSHLIFETLNEPRLVGNSQYEWTGGNAEARQIVNEYNAAALKAIRATGGNNTKRFVMMPGYAASSNAVAVNDIVLPDDDHLIVDIHGYAPWDFALNRTGTNQWSQNSGTYDIVSIFETAKNKFLNKGIPVVIGEFGALNKENESARAVWAKYYTETASSYGIPCVWWDNNQFFDSRQVEGEAFGLINRNNLTVAYPQIMAALVEGTKSRG